MNSLFAPWRMEFIESNKQGGDCVLCSIPGAQDLATTLCLHKAKYCYVVLNKFPYSHGHLMVVPYRHENNWTNLTSDELLELSLLTQKAIRILKKSFQAEAFNLGVNLGRAAGAGIESHVHQHIVPRWTGDFNFMPIFAETKVISEHLQKTFERLKAEWSNE